MKQLLKDINYGLKFYPELKLIISDSQIKVEGYISLQHPKIGEFDRYKVSISIPKNYSKCFPKVIEESKKIPRIADRHVMTDDTLCLAVEPEERLICRNGISFKFFLDKVLVPHLSRETYRNISGKYKDGEFSHGMEGLWEYFGDILNISTKKRIIEELIRIVKGEWPQRNDSCFCGSNIKFKKCHLKKWDQLLYLGNNYLRSKIAILYNDLMYKTSPDLVNTKLTELL